MMKIAIPLDGRFVTPTFDFATQLLVVSFTAGLVAEKRIIDIAEQLPSLRAAQLKTLNVNILICGAISNPLAAMVWHHGINIISGFSGAVDTILKEYQNGRMTGSRHTLPGFSRRAWQGYCGRKQCRFRGGRGQKPGTEM